jgi:hypothetical protein
VYAHVPSPDALAWLKETVCQVFIPLFLVVHYANQPKNVRQTFIKERIRAADERREERNE